MGEQSRLCPFSSVCARSKNVTTSRGRFLSNQTIWNGLGTRRHFRNGHKRRKNGHKLDGLGMFRGKFARRDTHPGDE